MTKSFHLIDSIIKIQNKFNIQLLSINDIK